jgi:FtsP/CotA-like multicopper oxidase with cupredoxin domain
MRTLWATVFVVFFVAVVTTQVYNVKAATTHSFTLYGTSAGGWGSTPDSISSPGPPIVVEQGDNVNLTLISNDGLTHKFFVSYTNNSSPNPGDPESADFSGTTRFQFVASDTVGTYTYHCTYHPTVMWGYFKVVPTGSIPTPEFQPLIMISLLVASTLIAALAYKRKRQV